MTPGINFTPLKGYQTAHLRNIGDATRASGTLYQSRPITPIALVNTYRLPIVYRATHFPAPTGRGIIIQLIITYHCGVPGTLSFKVKDARLRTGLAVFSGVFYQKITGKGMGRSVITFVY